MDSQERQRRVGHRINETAHQFTAMRLEGKVIAAEGHDLRLALGSTHLGQAVRVESAASDQVAALRFAAGALDRQAVRP